MDSPPEAWVALATLTALEIVLGIDNIIVISILVAEGMAFHIPKGYIYFAMAFSCGVEFLNLKVRARHVPPVRLHNPRAETLAAPSQ